MVRHLLIVDDQRAERELFVRSLGGPERTVTAEESAESALLRLNERRYDVLVTDLRLSGMNGIELCTEAHRLDPKLPVIVCTSYGDMQAAIDALRAGAYDFIPKPDQFDKLRQALQLSIERALEHRLLDEEVRRLRREVSQYRQQPQIIGTSGAIGGVRDLVDRFAEADAPVLLTGETGTGKELVARRLHLRSSRKNGPFVAFNCAAITETLLEAELFGHEKGAFTDAKKARPGLLVEADGGTLLLDEIGEFPLSMQPKLLRALQERRVRRVGGSVETEFDCRIVAATNRDLESEVEAGRFRGDLFFRLNVLRIHLPPLRARGNDVLALAGHFVSQSAKRSGKSIRGVSDAAAKCLLSYDWPGNVRELENAIESAVALTRSETLEAEDLPERLHGVRSQSASYAGADVGELTSLVELERRHIERVLDAVGGNKREAARVLQLDRSTLYRKLKRYRIP